MNRQVNPRVSVALVRRFPWKGPFLVFLAGVAAGVFVGALFSDTPFFSGPASVSPPPAETETPQEKTFRGTVTEISHESIALQREDLSVVMLGIEGMTTVAFPGERKRGLEDDDLEIGDRITATASWNGSRGWVVEDVSFSQE